MRQVLGIELSPEYLQLARKRISDSLAEPQEVQS